jgi:hypothetical protein
MTELVATHAQDLPLTLVPTLKTLPDTSLEDYIM